MNPNESPPGGAYKKMLTCLTGRTERKSRERAIKFPVKLMYVLDCGDYDDILTWAETGDFFMINDRNALEQRVLPDIFKQAKCSSFLRKLYRWGFTRRRGNTCIRQDDAYINPNFRRGDYVSCRNIRCNGNPNGEINAINDSRTSLPSLVISSSSSNPAYQQISQLFDDQRQQSQAQLLNKSQYPQQRSEELQQPNPHQMQSQLDKMYRELEDQLSHHRSLQQHFISQISASKPVHSSNHNSATASGIANVMNTGISGLAPYNFNQGSAASEDPSSMSLTAATSTLAHPISTKTSTSVMMSHYENVLQNGNVATFDQGQNSMSANNILNGNQSSSYHHHFPHEVSTASTSQSANMPSNGELSTSHAEALLHEHHQQENLNHYLQLHQHNKNLQRQLMSRPVSYTEKMMLLDDIRGYEEEIQKNQETK